VFGISGSKRSQWWRWPRRLGWTPKNETVG
jgi:hypothetical protein